MGPDCLEILIKIEDTFAIKIPDHEAEKILKVGDFHNTVWQYLSGRHSNKCKSQNLFYKLRKSFAEAFNFSPQQLKLNTSPNDIFPKRNRRHQEENAANWRTVKAYNIQHKWLPNGSHFCDNTFR